MFLSLKKTFLSSTFLFISIHRTFFFSFSRKFEYFRFFSISSLLFYKLLLPKKKNGALLFDFPLLNILLPNVIHFLRSLPLSYGQAIAQSDYFGLSIQAKSNHNPTIFVKRNGIQISNGQVIL